MSTGVAGTWHLRMRTPIGTIDADYRFTETDGGLTGTAVGAGETTTLDDVVRTPTPEGERLTWRQRVTRPMRLNLEYDVVVSGDTLVGHSRAGRLPRTAVSGERTCD
ncbi:hypothetical protein [Pseudonocardia sp. ICBG601]|uniref:hypothetical protein n=1 Tax=Pseudonocardia sp. ICBG601 TaxID=2846759 RepID=UPI001CF65060|nr:hypothetical protein [Pseudonocardia sp. ICBG601]